MAKRRYWVRYRLTHANGGVSIMEEHVMANSEFDAARLVEEAHTKYSTTAKAESVRAD